MSTIKSRRARLGFVVAALLGCLWAGNAQAQTTLRWKFKDGEKLQYSMDQKMLMKMNIQGMEVETKSTQTTDMTWAVLEVSQSGKAKMTQTMDRIRLKIDNPMFAVDYDSKEGKELEGPLGQLLGPLFNAMVGAEIAVTMNGQGESSDLKLPEKLSKAMQGNPILAQFGGMFTEEGMKNMMTQAGATLPKDPVSKGDPWDKKVEVKLPFGTMRTNMAFTYQGPETREGKKFEKIGLKAELGIEPNPGGMIQLAIKSQDMKGTIYFDNVAGRMSSSEIKQNTVMEITVMGQTIEQAMEQTITVKLSSQE